ncbi:hypothetical protein V8F20_002719 [Naviculisporaceae sp. PSN 640]
MQLTPSTISIVTSFLLLGEAVNAVAVPSKSIAKREAGDECFVQTERTCNTARDMVLTCLGPPGAKLTFGGTLNCIKGFQICDDGFCVLDPNRKKAEPSSVTEPEPSSTAAAVPEPTADGSDSGCGGFLGGI